MNTEENKSEPVPELTPEMQKIVAAAVAQAMAQQQPQAAGSNVNPPAEKTTSPAPSADFSEPKGTPGEWGMWLALRSCLTRYADFAGRASRSEFWYTVLANFLVLKALELLVVLGVFLAVCTGTPGVVVAVICGLLLLSYNILMMVPGLSVTVRRMHDTGRSGWAICFYFIPLAGPIIFLLFALGESGEANQYGKAPNHPVSDDEKAPAIVAWVIKTCRTLFVDNIGKTMVYAGGGVAAIAAVWTGLHFLLAPANPLKPLYEEGLLNEKSLGFGAAGKLNRAYQQYLEGDMEITGYPFVPELLKVAHDKEFSLSVEVVQALVEAGADINAVNNEGKSALTHAVGSNAEDSIRLLAQAGADIKAAVQDVYSYLTYAAKNNKCKSIRALIELGADVNAADAGGKTPLYRAVRADNAEAIKTLVELGANLQERNEKSHTLLHIAAGRNKAAALKQLLACPGADVNVTMLENTATPLHIAAYSGSAECVKVLLEAPGVNVNATAISEDDSNVTPLNCAAWEGKEEVIKLLLADSRTDINARCYNKKDRKYYHSITLLAKEGRDACLKLFLDTRAVPADDVKEASKAAVFHGTQKTVELLMWYTPDPEKVNAAARVASGQAASTTSSTKTAVSTENAVDSTDRTTEPSAHQPSSYGDAPVMLQGKLLVMDYSSAEHATVETDGETEQVAQYEVVLAGTYGTDGKQTLKPYSEDEYAITLGAYERKGADSAELAVLSFAAEPTKPLLEKLGDYIYLMPHRRLSSMFAMYGGDGMDTYYLQFTSPTGGTAKRVIEASCEATYVRNIRFTIESDPTAESAEAVFGSVAAPATLDGVWMKLSHVGGVVWFYCTEGKIYRCNDEIGDSNAAPEKPSRFKDVSQGSGYMFKDNLGRPYSAAHEFSYTPKGNTAELFMRVLTIKRTFLACFDAEKDYANDIVTYDGKPMKITFTSNNNGVLRGYCEGVWGMEEFGDPSQTYGLTIYTDGITAAPTVAAPVADDGMKELESFITALKEMNPKDSTQKLYCKRLLTLLPEIARGADVNMTLKETKGNTALHYACGMGHVELVTWLVQHGADVTKRTDRGKTPMECAGGNVEAIRAALGL